MRIDISIFNGATGGMMRPIVVRATFVTILSMLVVSAVNDVAPAYDLTAAANIALYPRPCQVSDLVFNNCQGRTVSLKDYKGKVVLLHFWSINCPACRFEEPLLKGLKRQFGSSGLEILGVNLVDPPKSVMNHATQKRPPFPCLFDGGRGFNLKVVTMAGKRTAFLLNPAREAILEVPGFPTTYIIDCKGNAVGYSVGPARWNNAKAVDLIRRLLAQTRNCSVNSQPRQARRGPVINPARF
jgi:thiol-disulfide isomerase/thioredoxin